MTDQKSKFTVISNPNRETHDSSVTNPIPKAINPYQEKFLRFVNQEGGRKFTVEDLLKW